MKIQDLKLQQHAFWSLRGPLGVPKGGTYGALGGPLGVPKGTLAGPQGEPKGTLGGPQSDPQGSPSHPRMLSLPYLDSLPNSVSIQLILVPIGAV